MTGVPIAIAVLALVALWLLSAWRGLVAARDAADATWRAIDVHLRDRQALVPALVAAVQAETPVEAETLPASPTPATAPPPPPSPWERADAERHLVAGIAADRHAGRAPSRPRRRPAPSSTFRPA